MHHPASTLTRTPAPKWRYTGPVTHLEPPDIAISSDLAKAISSGSLDQLRILLPSLIPGDNTVWQDLSSSTSAQSTIWTPRAYLLYLATQPPYNPSILTHILSLYPPGDGSYRCYSKPDPAPYLPISGFWRRYYLSYALEAAVDSNLPSMIRPFIDHGWIIDEEIRSPHTDDVYNNETILGLAVYKGAVEIAEYLLRSGADPNQILPFCRGDFPWTMMSRAAEQNNVSMLQLLRKYGGRIQGNMAMYAAAGKGSIDAMDWLVGEGAQVGEVVKYDFYDLVEDGQEDDETSNDGTPLHSAVKGGSMVAAEYLLAKGVDASIKDKQGRTAVDVAEDANGKDVADFIRGWKLSKR